MPANQSTPEVTRADREAAGAHLGLRQLDDGRYLYPNSRYQTRHNALSETLARHRLAHSPARGGDELREAARGVLERWDGASPNTMVELMDALRKALASTDMAGAGERAAIVAFLRRQSDIGANRGNEAEKGTTKRAAYGGGSLALHRAADAIEAGEHITNDNPAAPPVEGLTSGEGEPIGAMLICDRTGGRMFTQWPVPQHQKQEADSIYGSHGGYRTVPLYAASAKATATASVRELLAEVKLSIECAAGCDEGVDPDTASSEVMSFGGSSLSVAYDKVCATLTDSGTAATIGQQDGGK